ncbi:MAG TPA: GyrI-like domain-containing protein [Tenuifilaceae bacterium]|nr:GyrI-like domain-containing protein [Tenuifilaceae bacterium]
MKHEWKKAEKQFYLPKNKPELITVPSFKFFTINGKGNPNDNSFAEYISVLYSLSYAVKMSQKKGIVVEDYFDYAVYPLEGIWTLNNDAEKTPDGKFNKCDLIYKLMIRQPKFVTAGFAMKMVEMVKKKKPNSLLSEVNFEEITDGICIQMLHIGSYDSEPETFRLMHDFAEKENYIRTTQTHREIYLSDARKTPVEKLKTVLRFPVEKIRVFDYL